MKRAITVIISSAVALALIFSACGEVAVPLTPPPATAPAPTPEPTPTPDPLLLRAQELMSGMTQREKLCQLMVVKPEALTGESPVTAAGETTRSALKEYPVGGIIYSLDNLVTGEQTSAMISGAQEYSALGLFICADEEGGNVGRLMYKLGTTYFHDMFSYKEQGTAVARSNARTIGEDMRAYGFNTDLAPVADVWTNPENTVIGPRAYSDDYAEAAELVAAAVEGFKDAGVICCLKHFPGHGCTVGDSHDGAVVSDRTLEQLRAGELLPFVSGLEAGADMVMVGHITVPAIDELPATMSRAIVTDLLRGELGFEGVVITDGLAMGALSSYTDGEKCLNCLLAGCDLLLGVEDLPGSIAALESALAEGTLSAQRLDESVKRVLLLKLERGIIK